MNEVDRIIATMSPLELMSYASIGGRLTPFQLEQARLSVAVHKAEQLRRREIQRAVRIALEVWWDRPGVLAGMWPKRSRRIVRQPLKPLRLPRRNLAAVA